MYIDENIGTYLYKQYRTHHDKDYQKGILSILDLIQIGSEALVRAADKLDWSELEPSRDIDQTLKSFFSKRIKGDRTPQISKCWYPSSIEGL